jgi:protein-S-isoprenylcysteine O-methyltransferase Ste14
LLLGGAEAIGAADGEGDSARNALVFGLIILYFLRVFYGLSCLLPRSMPVGELVAVGCVFLPSIFWSFSIGAVRSGRQLSALDFAALVLHLFGSWITTWSEQLRFWWKQRPENKGRLYTAGLFSVVRNVNYSGDVINFTGFAVLTGQFWNAWVPVVMLLGFIFGHIEEKESYLRQRYAAEWPAYEASTKALIPGVW